MGRPLNDMLIDLETAATVFEYEPFRCGQAACGTVPCSPPDLNHFEFARFFCSSHLLVVTPKLHLWDFGTSVPPNVFVSPEHEFLCFS